MQFYEVIQNRTSIHQFKNTPVDKQKLSRMIKAAMMAPSWKNNTSYKFIIVDDSSQKNQLAQTVMNSTDKAADSIREAPVTAVIVANPNESGVVAGREYYLVDSAVAMEHLILAATSEGYGTCWIGAVDENKVREVLSIPENYRVIAMTPIGEINENKQHYPAKDFSNYVFLNTWQNTYNEITNNLIH